MVRSSGCSPGMTNRTHECGSAGESSFSASASTANDTNIDFASSLVFSSSCPSSSIDCQSPSLHKCNSLSFYYCNSTSLVNKQRQLNFEIVRLGRPEVLCFAETWFRRDVLIKLDGYSSFSVSREDKRGGGVAIYVREDIVSIEVTEKQLCSSDCEQVWCSIVIGPSKVLVGCMYRPSSLRRECGNQPVDGGYV